MLTVHSTCLITFVIVDAARTHVDAAVPCASAGALYGSVCGCTQAVPPSAPADRAWCRRSNWQLFGVFDVFVLSGVFGVLAYCTHSGPLPSLGRAQTYRQTVVIKSTLASPVSLTLKTSSPVRLQVVPDVVDIEPQQEIVVAVRLHLLQVRAHRPRGRILFENLNPRAR